MTALGWVLFALAAVALVALVQGHLELKAVLSRPPPGPPGSGSFPSVSVIRPVRGLDVGARENVLALLDLDYPGDWEALFVLDSEADPAYALIQELVAKYPTQAQRTQLLVAGPPPPGRTGKLNAMIHAVAHAQGTLVAFNDSDTRPEPKLLTQLVSALLSDPKAGSSFAPIYAHADAPLSGDIGYGLLVNAWYGPSVMRAAAPDGSMPFIMGQLMVMRREAMDAIGGVGCAEGQFVDDMFIGREVVRAGWKNLVVNAPLRVVTGGMGLTSFLKTFRRWVLFSESGLSFDFARPNWVRVLSCWVAWLVLATAAAMGAWLAALVAVLAIAASGWSQVRLQRACHGPPIPLRHAWMALALPLLSAGVALSTRISRRVDWRGRSYNLDSRARLGVGNSPAGST